MQGNYVIAPATPGFELWECSNEAFDACRVLENFEEAFEVYAVVAWKINALTGGCVPLALGSPDGERFQISALKQPDGSFLRQGITWYAGFDEWIAALVEEGFSNET